MRVVAGSAGGLSLRGPVGDATRPTTDKVREAIFNSLGSTGVIPGAAVLDLFAGTGACGIEALSRGAKSCVFVEKDRRAVELIRANLRSTGLEGKVVVSDVLRFLADAGEFDVAFADPPYAFDQWTVLQESIHAQVLVCESDRPVAAAPGWSVFREKRYGGTTVTIIERIES